MTTFSEESKLLIEHWATVEEIFEAEKRLRVELSRILLSIKPELVKQEWWRGGWKFDQYGDSQVYISHNNWRAGSDYVVWIGIEDFIPESMFGMENPPNLYVWVSGKRDDLAQMLVDKIHQSDSKPLGMLQDGQDGYVLGHHVEKYISGELNHYGDAVKEQIMNFLVHYAEIVWKLDSEIRRCLKKK